MGYAITIIGTSLLCTTTQLFINHPDQDPYHRHLPLRHGYKHLSPHGCHDA